jgi:four helix bundle protein
MALPHPAIHSRRMSGGFEFEKLEVYQLALRLAPLVASVCDCLPAGYGDLRSHLRRSERSIRLNIAEGAGKHRPGGKAERFRTARGSANECAAALDEARRLSLACRPAAAEAMALCHRIISMLTRLILYWERRTGDGPRDRLA